MEILKQKDTDLADGYHNGYADGYHNALEDIANYLCDLDTYVYVVDLCELISRLEAKNGNN